MRGRALAGPVISLLASHQQMRFADHAAWLAHLDHLGITALRVTPEPADRFAGHWFASRPNPVSIATEGALWGSVQAHDLLPDTVIVSDDAGQFVVGQHALCWVHAERLVHKLDEHVVSGQMTARIDDRDYRTALAQAEAWVDAAKANIANIDAEIAVQQTQNASQVQQQGSLTFAHQQASRYDTLAKDGVGSLQDTQQYTSQQR
jgi:hypothetical protein